jgi:hypothetical protein
MESVNLDKNCGVWVPITVAARLKNISPLTVQRKFFMDEVKGTKLGDLLVVCLDDISEGTGKVGRPSLQ